MRKGKEIREEKQNGWKSSQDKGNNSGTELFPQDRINFM